MDVLFTSAAAVSVMSLAYASVCDLRYREISDTPWRFISSVGVLSVGLTALRDGAGVLPVTASVSALFIFGCLTVDKHPLIMAAISVLFPLSAYLTGADAWAMQVSLSPVFVVLFYVLYLSGAVTGGADAKCLMALSIMFPASFGPLFSGHADPGITGFLFPPPVQVLFMSCLITVVAGGAWILYKRRSLALPLSSDYRISIEEARRSHVWVMEDVSEGRIIRTDRSEDRDGVCDRLGVYGAEDVLVSPMFPFIVPITVSVAVLLLTGCPFIS